MLNLEPFMREIEKLKESQRLQPDFRYAIVTSASPLRIRYEGWAEEVLGTPTSIVSGLPVGARVLCMRLHRRDIVLGVAKAAGSQKTLWSGAIYMNASQMASLSERVSEQENGIVLAWSRYSNGAPNDDTWNYSFIPKGNIARHPAGGGTSIPIEAGATGISTHKYIYIRDHEITGHANNNTGDASRQVLRYVYGV